MHIPLCLKFIEMKIIPHFSLFCRMKIHPILSLKTCNKTCINFIHLRFEIYGIKSTPIIHLFVGRKSIHLAYEKLVIKYDPFKGWNFKVWKFIPISSTVSSAIYVRKIPFHHLNCWNPYWTGFTVFLCQIPIRIQPSRELLDDFIHFF